MKKTSLSFARTLLVASTVAALSPSAHAAILIDNYPTSNDSTGFDIVDGALQSAVGFTTPNQAYTVNDVHLRLSNYISATDTPQIRFFTDNGGEPSSTPVGAIFSNPASATAPVNDRTFSPVGTVSLAANTTYWLVVAAATGSGDFTWTASTTDSPNPRTPAGLATFVSYQLSGDNGATYDPNPFFQSFQINATAVPEPVHGAIATASGLLGFCLWRRWRRNRA